MSSQHSAQHLEALEALFTGEGDPREALDSSPLADCPTCRAELDALMSLDERLAAAGRDERRSIALSEGEEGAPEHLVDEVLRPLVESADDPGSGAGPAPGPTATARWFPWLAAAAAFTVFLFFANREPAEPGGGGAPGAIEDLPSARGMLGAGEVELDGGSIFRTGAFTWRAPLPQDGWFVVRVFDPAAPLDAPPLWTSERLTEHGCSPPRADIDSWPDLIEWEVQVFDVDGESKGVALGSERRSP